MKKRGAGGTGERTSIEFWFTAAGTLAGIAGAVAAAAVFVFHTADGRSPASAATPTVSTAPFSARTSSAGAASGVGGDTKGMESTGETRYLASLNAEAGSGFVQVKGRDLRLPCPTNESDDTDHEVTYGLPATYASLASGMSVSGQADPDATAGIQVFIQHRQDRSDRQVQVGNPIVLRQATSATLTRPLGDAVELTLRITCTSSDQVVLLTAPRIIR
jgi:hypothetical protein